MFLNMVMFSFFFIFFASFPGTQGDVYTTIDHPLLVGYLSSLTSINRTQTATHPYSHPRKHHLSPHPSPHTHSDSRTNSANNNPLHTITGVNATGLGFTLPGFVVQLVPSDVNGAVGLKYYVQTVNTNFGIFDKTNGLLVGAIIPPLAPWSGLGGLCDPTVGNFTTDPVVMYDRLADRWVLSILASNNRQLNQTSHCIAVSVTSDPRGAYYQYEIQFGELFPDYPKGSTWPDGYYFTYNNFVGDLTAGVTVCALDRLSILRGNYHSTLLCFDVPTASSLLPSDVDGETPPPVGSPNYLLSLDLSQGCTSSFLLMYKIYLDWRFPNNSVMVGPKTITVSPYTWCADVENIAQQPQTTLNLEALTDRLMYRLVYRYLNGIELLLATHSLVTDTGIPNVRWYEIRDLSYSVPVAYQQGDLPNNGINRYFPSIAMDKNGNIAIGYTASDKTIFPSIYYTGRESYDALNTTRMEKVLYGGKGSVIGPNENYQRWGDYSSLTVDPVDGCTFYYTNQYLDSNQYPSVRSWSTRIVSFRFEDCVRRDHGDDDSRDHRWSVLE